MRLHLPLLPTILAAALAAQDGQVASGPEPGTPLAKVEVYAPLGPRAGETFDAAAALGTGPGALLFVHELSRNTAPVIRGLDGLALRHRVLGFRAFTVFLAADRTAGENQIERSSRAMGMANPMVVSADGAEGPGSYALNRKCTLTLVLAKDGKVVRSVGFTDTGRQDLPALERWIAEVTGPVPADAAGIRRLLAERYPQAPDDLRDLAASLLLEVQRLERMAERRAGDRGRRMDRRRPMQRDAKAEQARGEPARQREGAPPEDEELRGLLRSAIRRDATAADLDRVFQGIDERVGDDAELRRQAVEMFKLMLSLEYGNDDARRRARKYLDDHGGGPRIP